MAGPWDAYAAPAPQQPQPPAAKGPWSDYQQPAPAAPASGPQFDQIFSRGALGASMDLFGQGFKDGWGSGLKLSPETEKAARDYGFFRQPGEYAPFKAFNEWLVRPAVGALHAAQGLYTGAQAVGAQAFKDIGQEKLGRDFVSIPDAFMGSPHALSTPRPVNLPLARDLGVIGPEGEAGFAGTAPKPPAVPTLEPGTVGPAQLSLVEPKGAPGIAMENLAGRKRTLGVEMPKGPPQTVVFRDETGTPKGVADFSQGAPTVYVDPAFRGQGIASQMYEHAKANGIDVDALSGSGPMTPDGAAFVNARREADFTGMPSPMDADAVRTAAGKRLDNTLAGIDQSAQMPRTTGETIPLQEGPRVRAEPAMAADMPRDPHTLYGPDETLVDKAGNINLDRIGASADVKQVIRDVADQGGGFQEARRGQISLGETEQMANALGMEPEALNRRKLGEAFNAEQITAARNLLVQSANNVFDLARKAASGDEAAVADYAQARLKHMAIQEQVAGLTAEAGRALNAFKIMAGESKEAMSLGDMLKQTTGKGVDDFAAEAKAVAGINDPAGVSRFLMDARKPTFGDKFLYYYLNGLLSGPFTHTAYAISNAVYAFQQAALVTPVASAIGAVRQLLPGADAARVMPGEVAARLWGLVQGTPEAITAGWRAFKAGVPDTLPGAEPPTRNAIAGTRSSMPLGESVLPEKAAQALGIGVGVPSRVIGAIHSVFASLGYRTEINAQAWRIASREGLEGDAFRARVADLAANPTDKMMDAGRDNADYMTFTQELGDFGKKIQALANHNVLTKMAMPFVRTPGDIFKAAYEQTPLAVLDDDMRADLTGKNGAVARDTAAAKVVVGSAIAGMAGYWASQGVITGGGPTDRKERAVWLLTNRPYSVRIGDTMYDYRKMGSLGVLLVASADLHDIYSKGVSEDEYGQAGTMLVKAGAKAVIDESFMRGLSDLIEAVQDPDRYGAKFAYGLGASVAVPFSVGTGQVASMLDPDMRSARDFVSVLKNKLPGERETLFPVRDLWGQPVPNDRAGMGSILAMRHITDDPVNLELSRLGIAPAPLQREIRGVKLDDALYDEYQRTAGPYAKTTLDSMVNTPGWSQMPDFARKEYITAVIDNSRKSASTLMMVRHPEIIQQATDKKVQALGGSVAK